MALDVNQALIGQNYWLTVDPVLTKMGEMKPEIIRVGGIGYNESYKGTTWYDNVLNNIEKMGATPMVQISEQWTSAQTLALLKHFKDTKRTINYFSIGNEPDHNNRVSKTIYVNGVASTVVDVDAIIAYYNKLGPIIRDYYPDAILIGPCWANFYDSFINNYYLPFIDGTKNTKDKNGKYILNVFSFHTYASAFGSGGVELYDLSTFETRMNLLLPKIAAVNTTRPSTEKLSWSVTELHTTYNNDSINVSGKVYAVPTSHKTYGFYAGQYFAQIYGYAMTHDGFGVMPWSIIEGETNRNFGDLGIFDHDYVPRSTYHHTQMLSTNLRTTGVSASSSKNDVEVVAMDDGAGTTVMVMNTQANSYNMSLSLDINSTATNTLMVKVNALHNKLITDVIGKETTLLFVFDAQGNLTKRISYSSADATIRKDPTVTTYNIPVELPVLTFINLPASNTITQGDTLGMHVNATHSTGISNVILYLNGVALHQENLAPYDWTDASLQTLAAGTYTLKAVATSISGQVSEKSVSIIVKAKVNQVPTVALTAPANNSAYTSPASIALAATASDVDGSIASVQFYNGTTLIGTSVASPYAYAWTNVAAGTYMITAVATDNSGAKTTSGMVTVIVSAPVEQPVLTFINLPASNTITQGDTLGMHVDATHSTGISNVILYLNGVALHQENLAPYDWTDASLQTLAAGTYTLKAVATSISGQVAEKSVMITVKAVVVGPVSNAYISQDFVYYTWNTSVTQNIQFMVLSAQGVIMRDYIEQNVHVGANQAWIKDAHQLNPGTYLLMMIVNGATVASLSFTK